MTSDETVTREDVVPGETIRAKVLPDTPNALQLGSRCAEQGYGFFWHPFQMKPSFVSPDGTLIECDVDENFIPVIRRPTRDAGHKRRPREIRDGSALAMPVAEVQTDQRLSRTTWLVLSARSHTARAVSGPWGKNMGSEPQLPLARRKRGKETER